MGQKGKGKASHMEEREVLRESKTPSGDILGYRDS